MRDLRNICNEKCTFENTEKNAIQEKGFKKKKQKSEKKLVESQPFIRTPDA